MSSFNLDSFLNRLEDQRLFHIGISVRFTDLIDVNVITYMGPCLKIKLECNAIVLWIFRILI